MSGKNRKIFEFFQNTSDKRSAVTMDVDCGESMAEQVTSCRLVTTADVYIDGSETRVGGIIEHTGAGTSDTDVSARKGAGKQKTGGPNEQWQKDHTWLEFTNCGGMICSLCQKYATGETSKGSNVWFSVPCNRIRKDSVVSHEHSHVHKLSVQAKSEEEMRKATGYGKIEHAFSSLQSLQSEAFAGALKCMYWLAKHEIPHTTTYESLLKHCERMGCNYLKHLNQGGNAHYTSERIMQELLQVLAGEIRTNIVEQVKRSPFFTLLCDETTDVAITKQLILYVKYLNASVQTSPVSFLCICDLPDGKAEVIFNCLVEQCESFGFDLKKLVGFGSDGAAVMVGRKNGVAKLLRDKTDGLLVNCHCVNHRLALAVAESANEVPYLKKFKTVVTQLFYFYQNSTVRLAGLHSIQCILQLPELKLKSAKDHRWLSHDEAVQALQRSFSSVLMSLEKEAEERSDTTAFGLVHFLKTYEFISALIMFSEILPVLSCLSKAWQREDVDLTVVKQLLSATIRTLESKAAPESFNALATKVDDAAEEASIRYNKTSDKVKFQKTFDKYLMALLENIKDRFPEMPLMESFCIFSYTKLHSLTKDEADSFYSALITHYSVGLHAAINKEEALAEWAVAYQMIQSEDYKVYSQRQTLQKLCFIKELTEAFPNISKLASIALCLPISTAQCERGFSSMKRIKTLLRNRMNQSTLNNLMMISIEGSDCDSFEYEAAAQKWVQQKKRRINV